MPKHGGLKSARKRQESATFLQCSFLKLQCSFSFAAAQLFVEMTSAPQKSECCSETSAAQHSENAAQLSFSLVSADRKRGQREGVTSKTVKKCQRIFRYFSRERGNRALVIVF